MSVRRRIPAIRLLFDLSLLFLAGQVVRWQWLDAYGLAVKACRQRLLVQAQVGWARADFCDRYGRPLTGRALDARRPAAAIGADPLELRYGETHLATHLLGYVNPGDGRGAAGLEEACDDLLVCGPGLAVATLLDGRRKPLEGLGLRLLEQPGREPRAIRVTLDRDLQNAVEAIANQSLPKGAIVVMSPWTGEILAMVSRPDFDPAHPQDYLATQGSPFLNRAVTAYHPGSIFKLAVLATVLERQPEDFFRLYQDEGRLDVGSLSFHCPGRGHGEVTLADALAFSCNTTFIRLGLELGAEKFLDTAERLGLGSPALQDLPGEDPGELPAAGGLALGDVANLAIGQRDIYVTPVQVARLVSAVANGGYLVPGRVLAGVEDSRGRPTPLGQTDPPQRVLSLRTALLMQRMMAGVVRYGTGRVAAVPGGAGGKTGTAQTGQLDAQGRPFSHAWFTGFAPLDGPRYVAVVFVEEGDSGGRVAAPIFRRVMQAALALKQ